MAPELAAATQVEAIEEIMDVAEVEVAGKVEVAILGEDLEVEEATRLILQIMHHQVRSAQESPNLSMAATTMAVDHEKPHHQMEELLVLVLALLLTTLMREARLGLL